MRINHNIAALNTHRQLTGAQEAQSKSMEKLSSGLRINRAGDDAAGLAISEKMRGQIRGLDMASKNAQDGISLIQTAEGALNETHSILQRMRELSAQSSNGTNTDADRSALQDEMNQMSNEVNRIGNTTEFNTQKLLQGDGKVNLANTGLVTAGTLANGKDRTTTEATQTTTIGTAAASGNTATFSLNGISLAVTFTATGANGGAAGDSKAYGVTAQSANVAVDGAAPTTGGTAAGLRDALAKMIDSNATLKGQYTVTGTGNDITVTAVKGGAFEGAAGNIGLFAKTGAIANTGGTANTGITNNAVAASSTLNFSALTATGSTAVADTNTNISKLAGTGITVDGQQLEFYDSSKGAYTGKAIGIDISSALSQSTAAGKTDQLMTTIANTTANKLTNVTLTAGAASTGTLIVTAKVAGTDGNKLTYADGGVQKTFETSFQIGANTGQAMGLSVNDMRSKALGITGKAGDAGFSTVNNITDGTSDVKGEAALDISTKDNAAKSIAILDKAIASVSSERSKLGAVQNRLEHTINNLGTSSENLTAAESRIRDVDMAKEMMNQTKNSILSQAAQAMLAQANQAPQGVLQLLR